MSRICGECDRNIDNSFYAMSAVIRDVQHTRLAFSDMEISLCFTELCRVSTNFLKSPKDLSSFLGYAIDVVTGTVGGFSGTVQISGI